FCDLVDKNIENDTSMIIKSYYTHIVTLVTTKKYMNDIPKNMIPSFIKSASTLLAYQIIKILMTSISDLLNVLEDNSIRPSLSIILKCQNNDLITLPTKDYFFSRFYYFIDEIASAGLQLQPLESWVDMKNQEFISAVLPEWYMLQSYSRLSKILENYWEPIDIYVQNLQSKFKVIYSAEAQSEIRNFIDCDYSFQEGAFKLEDFKKLITEIDGLPNNEYLEDIRISQFPGKSGLKHYTEIFRGYIIQELLQKQRKFNHEICSTFEKVKSQVLNTPETTKELLELGKHMLTLTTTFMEEMEEKINFAVSKMLSVIEMTTLDYDDIELNRETVNWLVKIKPIFEEGNLRYEQMKFKLEENLQSRKNNLITSIEDLFTHLEIMDLMDNSERIFDYIEEMRKLVRSLDRLDDQVKWINNEESTFNFPQTYFPRIKELKDIIIPFYELIYQARKWQRDSGVWLDGPFEFLDASIIENRTADYYAWFNKVSKEYRTKIKIQIATGYPYIFSGSVDDPDPLNQPAPMNLCHQLLESIKWLKKYMPLVCLVNPALNQRHWDEMSLIAGYDITPDAGTTFRKLINQDLMKDVGKYEAISVNASKEAALVDLFNKIKQEWDNVLFTTMIYKDSDVTILTQLDDVMLILEEHTVKLQGMRGSAFVKPIENDVKIFYEVLVRIKNTIDEWSRLQVQWIYLLPIFTSPDIIAQLPEEASMFSEVNQTFCEIMESVGKDPRVKESAGSLGMLEKLEKANELMEKINQGVVEYLEKKRLFFPRFFFLSNDDMLEILSETKDPLRVQPHLNKCFEGIVKLGFNKDREIYAMTGDDGEEIMIQEIISTDAAKGCVEKWLIKVEQQMVTTIKHQIMVSYFDYEVTERVKWALIWPGQVVLCVSQIYWSLAVTNSLLTRKLNTQNRTTLNALITIDVHAQDVVELLIDKRITSETDFDWLAQLRYYWQDNVLVRIINSTVKYAYEYLGNCSRLVITPLTDRCYRTLIGAYSLHLNGAPEGPAGTGKTETTKDLARAIAVQCVVFNCSEALDYKNMGKFFKGLAACGAWACFDEFNRIELEVLSVVAQQILCIVQAVRAHLEIFIFEGTELSLNPAVYVCITMNPGYAGRSELPDNLKVLFRTVAMMVPDYSKIGEIFLYSSGFNDARVLSLKIKTTYKLCSEQLSTQSHYDYGMRAVKTVLLAAQNLKIKFPDADETVLLLRAIVDVNLPKFLAHDVPLFQGIISDLFPDVQLPSPNYQIFLKAIKQVLESRNLQPVDGFLLKIIQTYEMMIVRHGFMLVGDPSGGKTCVLHTLADSLTLMAQWGHNDLGAKTIYTTINPKSITIGQLYGQFDPVSSEWTDGICAVAFRQYSTNYENSSRKWIIFDGPVDAVWIENLNTVLDDNKKLCLTSGEVIQMTGTMSMIFEAMDLVQASPATVSRCGMIYIEPHVLGWRPVAESWYKTLPSWSDGYLEIIRDMFEWLIDACLEFIRKKCKVTLYAGQINQVTSTFNLFKMVMDDAVDDPRNKDSEEIKDNIKCWVQAATIFSIVWGLSGTLDRDSHRKFNDFFTNIWKNQDSSLPIPESISRDVILLPSEDINDSYYVFRGKGHWKSFSEALKTETLVEASSISQMLVPTVDTVKYQRLFQQYIKHNKRFLVYGATGTGKSFYIQDLMTNKLKENYIPNLITFTARTSAALAQELVISKLQRRKRHYGPGKGNLCVVFIDDVNMPAKEVYGAQPAIELLRQMFDHDYWYDSKEPNKITVSDTLFICAMSPPGGMRQKIYQRFLRHFNLLTINEFTDESILRIFSTIALAGYKRNGFASDIIVTVNPMVNATLEIFKCAIKDLRPTPGKSHYAFNLRDFARVITGCVMLKKDSVESKSTFTRLWVHETLRVFGDRLVDSEDHLWLFDKIKQIVLKIFNDSFESIFSHLPKENDQLTEKSLKSLIFGNFMDDSLDKKYEEVTSMELYQQIVQQYLKDYNLTHRTALDIVVFRYALEHLARVSRIMATPGGNLLMVGVGGSGRQSLTKLAAAMADYDLFQPEITSTYGVNEWHEDIKRICKTSGAQGKDLVFLISESQITEQVFLSDIDGLLNSGEVPNLFNAEERQEIIEICRSTAAKEEGDNNVISTGSIVLVLAYFLSRCKEKLHLMLCFTPIGESFRTRLRLYPSLLNCCTIDWFEVWPEEALEQVAVKFTKDINVDDQVKVNAVIACKYFHVCAKNIAEEFYQITGRRTYITSTGFLDLIRNYARLINIKQKEITEARARYVNGLDKLAFAAEEIKRMKINVETLKPQLEASARETVETMKQIENESKGVEEATIQVKKDEQVANNQAEIAGALKIECEADLASALPVLEEALKALDTLKPKDISLVKTMKNPPAGIKLVMAAVCVMLNIPPDRKPSPDTGKIVLDYWKPSKKLLSDIKFLDSLKNYDKDNIPLQIIETIKRIYLTDKNFEPRVVAKASQAAEGLCKWVRAMILYDKVAREIAPKKQKLQDVQKEYLDTMIILEEKRIACAELTGKLTVLKENLEKILKKKINLENVLSQCRNKLIRAEKLISGLGGEERRWLKTAENLKKSYETLPGDILISCAIISYLAPFTSVYRVNNIDKWIQYIKNLKIPSSEDFSFVEILSNDLQVNTWNILGLPRDIFSTENAIIMASSKRWSLFIDPQSQANRWIRTMERFSNVEIIKLTDKNYSSKRWSLFIDPQSQANRWIRTMERFSNVEIIKLTDKNYMTVVERSIEFGYPVLIENIYEQLDASLDPILMKNIYKVAGEFYITLGEKIIKYDDKFRLYLTTKLRNPHYVPEIFNKVTIINFSLTKIALEDQLLGIVVAKERPELQEKREYLIVEGAANQKALKQVEDSILKTLSSGTGSEILENEEAVGILDSSKILSADIIKKQKASEETQREIEIARNDYALIAKYSSALYYTCTDLPNIDPMYQYSLTWFINLYVTTIENAHKSKLLKKRLKFLQDTFTYNLYQNICRSLFEKDKPLYGFILYTTILIDRQEITIEELNLFLSGINVKKTTNPVDWLPDKSWIELCQLNSLGVFKNFLSHFLNNLDAWKSFYHADINFQLPTPWDKDLTEFHKLIIMKIIHPDKVLQTMIKFIEQGMGSKFVLPVTFDLTKSYNDSNSLNPLIFILSQGSDPTASLFNFATAMNYQDKFSSVSLGQGQGARAEKLIRDAQKNGDWVCLQNCHLAGSWMPQLEKIYEEFDSTNTSVNFRLWLTSYPTPKFPISILENAIKMTNEPPKGLQQNLMRLYSSEPLKNHLFFDRCPGKDKIFARLIYGLCFFHAVIQERRNYGPQGWNIPYGFNESDFEISITQLEIFINQYNELPLKAITYLTGECNYGGRVTDDRDRRCLQTILQDYYNDQIISNDQYKLTESSDECYWVPRKNNYQEYVKQIQRMPLDPQPEVFGLHANARITRDLETSRLFLESLRKISGTVSLAGGVNATGDFGSKQDESLLVIKQDIYERLPDLFDLEAAVKNYPVRYDESMNTVLVQELERYNNLLGVIRTSLEMLENAIKGIIVMTTDLEIIYDEILSNKIPSLWIKSSAYPSLKSLGNFVSDLIKRLEFLKNWVDHGKPDKFWISGFSFVHGFLTGAMQNFARKYKISIDKIEFDFEVMSGELNSAPVDGVYIYGLYLTGGRWDSSRKALAESYSKILYDPMGSIWLKPTESTEIININRHNPIRYECPLYITSERFGTLKTTGHSTNYVLMILLDTELPVSHWIKRGLALLCQLND
ncbi:Similar to DNAH7: Dynein heavy chain 7, partial [Cotesia congregata]